MCYNENIVEKINNIYREKEVIIMDFVGKSFSGFLKFIVIVALVVVCGYLLIYAIPFLLVIGLAIFAFVKLKNHFKISFATKNANSNVKTNSNTDRSDKQEANFKDCDNLDGDIVDVDYKDV